MGRARWGGTERGRAGRCRVGLDLGRTVQNRAETGKNGQERVERDKALQGAAGRERGGEGERGAKG